MKLSDLNQNNIELGLNKSTLAPDTQGPTDLKKPLQIAKTGVDKEEESKISGDPLTNIKREAGMIANPLMPAPFKDVTNMNKPPNLSNI